MWARAMEIPYAEVDRLAKMVPTTLGIELEDALEEAPQLKSAVNSDEKLKDLMNVALRLEGLSRHASTHAAGVVISPQPLTGTRCRSTRPTAMKSPTQYDMNALERIGLLKMDFLGADDADRAAGCGADGGPGNRGVKVDIDDLDSRRCEHLQVIFARRHDGNFSV
jgi:DNA polymerase-3 subunit alpha